MVDASRSKTETIEGTLLIGPYGMAMAAVVEVIRKYCLHVKVKHSQMHNTCFHFSSILFVSVSIVKYCCLKF